MLNATKTKTIISIDGKIRPDLGLDKRRIVSAAEFFASRCSRLVDKPYRNVAIIVQNDAQSDEAHRAILGVDGATDVITQSYDPMPHEPMGVYGELYVNQDQALRFVANFRRSRWTAADEFLLYVAHGMDHLTGADDHSAHDYAKMRRRELSWLRQLRPHALEWCGGQKTASTPLARRTGI